MRSQDKLLSVSVKAQYTEVQLQPVRGGLKPEVIMLLAHRTSNTVIDKKTHHRTFEIFFWNYIFDFVQQEEVAAILVFLSLT